MRHRRGNKKLSKPTDQRIALLRSLVRSLIIYEKIQTTDKSAAAAKRYAERLITLAKKGTVHHRREALKALPDKEVVTKLFSMADRFSDRNGGYLRIVKAGKRQGDNAAKSILSIVD